MLQILAITGLLLAAALFAMWIARLIEESRIAEISDRLLVEGSTAHFDHASLHGLPDPAQRYLRRAIAPGTRLADAVLLRMNGRMRTTKDGPWMPMTARQVLSPPRGTVWRARVGSGVRRIIGFDAAWGNRAAMRWWLWGVIPVARASGEDVVRSAAGRVAGEAVWIPCALLPDRGATWAALTDDSAQVTLQVGSEAVTLTLFIAPDGRLMRVTFPRWKGDGASSAYATFAMDVDGELHSGGYTIPGRGRAGWRPDQPDAFEFFAFELTEVRYR